MVRSPLPPATRYSHDDFGGIQGQTIHRDRGLTSHARVPIFAANMRGPLHFHSAFLALILVATSQAGGVPPPRTVADEIAVLEKGRIRAKQNALARLGTHKDPEAGKVLRAQFELFRAGQLPLALWLDLFESAARRDDTGLKTLLAERARELEKTRDPLVRFRECLEGGDGETGRAIFTKKPEAGCIRCHSVDGKGGQIGPELTWLRRSADRAHLLESLIVPNATLAVGFQCALLKLKGGEEISGVISGEGADELTITSVADGKKRKVKTAEITERTPLPSLMPPHFGAVLSKREIRDVIEFLAAGD